MARTTGRKGKGVMQSEIVGRMGEGMRTIAALVFWRALSGARIPRVALRDGFERLGLGSAVHSPRPEKMLTEAVGRSLGSRKGSAKAELKAKGQCSVYRILMRRDEAGRARYLEEAQVSLDRYAPGAQLQTMTLQGVPADPARDALIRAIADNLADVRANVLGGELSDALVDAMEVMSALTLRTGVYFVGADQVDRARGLAALVEGVTDASVSVWELRDTPANAATARIDARRSFLDRLDALKREVAEFAASTPVADAAPGTVATRVRHFKDLDARVGLWADILGSASDELRASIGDARQALLGPYLGLLDDTAAT
jgi:hypothetical protein